MADEATIEISAAFAPEHISTTLEFAKVLPATSHPLEVERAVKIAGLASLVPLERLDARWALIALASHSLALEAELQKQERRLGAWQLAAGIAWWVIILAFATFIWWMWRTQ